MQKPPQIAWILKKQMQLERKSSVIHSGLYRILKVLVYPNTDPPPLQAHPGWLWLEARRAAKVAVMQTHLILRGQPTAQSREKARESVKFGRAEPLCTLANPPPRHWDTGEPQPLLAPQRLYKECKTTPNYFSPTPTRVRREGGGRWSEVTSSTPIFWQRYNAEKSTIFLACT